MISLLYLYKIGILPALITCVLVYIYISRANQDAGETKT